MSLTQSVLLLMNGRSSYLHMVKKIMQSVCGTWKNRLHVVKFQNVPFKLCISSMCDITRKIVYHKQCSKYCSETELSTSHRPKKVRPML